MDIRWNYSSKSYYLHMGGPNRWIPHQILQISNHSMTGNTPTPFTQQHKYPHFDRILHPNQHISFQCVHACTCVIDV